jgi:hypothetical protein
LALKTDENSGAAIQQAAGERSSSYSPIAAVVVRGLPAGQT